MNKFAISFIRQSKFLVIYFFNMSSCLAEILEIHSAVFNDIDSSVYTATLRCRAPCICSK